MSRNNAIEMLIRSRVEGRAELTGLASDMEKLAAKARAAGDAQADAYDAIAKGLRDAASRSQALGEMSRHLEVLGETGAITSDEMEALTDAMGKLGKTDAAVQKFKALDTQAKAAADHLDKLKAGLSATESRMTVAAGSTNYLRTQVLAQSAAVQTSGETLKNTRAQLDAASAALKAAGISTRTLTGSQGQLDASSQALVERYKQLQAQTKTAADEHKRSRQSLSQLQGQLNSAERDSEKLSRSMRAQAESVKAADAAANKLKADAAALAAQLRAAGIDTNNLRAANQQLQGSYQQLAQAAAALKAIGDARQLLNVKSHQEVTAEILKIKAAYETLKSSGKLTSKELAQAHAAMRREIAALEESLEATTDAANDMNGALVGIGASAAGLFVAGEEAIKFESAMSDVAKVLNGTDAEVAALGQRLKALSTTDLPYTADQLSEIAAAGAKIGTAKPELEKFVVMVGQIGTAFGMTAEQAGTAIATLQTIFGTTLDQTMAVADGINALNNNLGVAESAIVEVLVRSGGMAKQFGMTAEQTAALSASFLKLGKSPEVAGTAINALLGKLATATSQGEDFQNALISMGTSAEQMAVAIRENPEKALSKLLGMLSSMDKAAQSKVLVRMFGAEYAPAIATLVGSIDTYNKAMGIAANASDNAGAVQKEFANRMKTTEVQLQLMVNSLREAAIELGTTFLPIIKAVAGGVGATARAVAEFVREFPNLSLAAAGIVSLGAAVSTAALAFGALKSIAGPALGAIATQLVRMTPAITSAATAARGLAVAMGGTLGVLGAVAAAGIGVGTILHDNFAEARQLGVGLVDVLGQMSLAVEFYFDAVKAVFTDTTLEQAQEDFKKKLAEHKAIIVGMYEDAEKAPMKAAAATEAATEQTAAALQKHREETQKTLAAYKDLSAGARDALIELKNTAAEGATTTEQLSAAIDRAIKAADSPQAFKALQDQLDQMLGSGKLTRETFDEVTRATKEAARQQEDTARTLNGLSEQAKAALQGLIKLRQDGTASAEQLTAAVKTAIEAADSDSAFAGIRQQLQGLADDGQITQAVFADLSKAAEAAALGLRKPVDHVAELIDALKEMGDVAGKESIEARRQVEAGIGAALEKLSDKDLPAMAYAVEKEFGRLSAAARTVAGEALKRLGIDADLALDGISSESKKATAALEALGATGAATGRGLKLALQESLERAETPAAVEKVRAAVKSLGDAGALTGDQLGDALDEVDRRAKQVAISISELQEDFEQLGITSTAAMQAQADAAKASLQNVEEAYRAGKATALDYVAAAKAALGAVEKAGTDTEVAMAKAKAEMAEAAVTASAFKSAAERAGLIAKKSGEEVAAAANKAKEAVKEQTAEVEKGAEKQEKALSRVTIAMEKYGITTGAALKRVTAELDLVNQRAEASSEAALAVMQRNAEGIKHQSAAVADLARRYDGMRVSIDSQIPVLDDLRSQFDLLDDAQLEGLESALEGARQRVIDLRNEVQDAKAALDDMAESMQDDIDEADGNDQAVINRKYAREKQRLDEQRARGGGDAAVEKSYRDALALLQEQQRREEVEAKAKATERTAKAENDKAPPTPETTPPPIKTERFVFELPGSPPETIDVVEGQGDTLKALMNQLANLKKTSL